MIRFRKKFLWLLPLAFGLASDRAWRWRQNRATLLRWGSRIAPTAKGEIEYAHTGEGQPVLVLHGTPGGYDQGMAISRILSQAPPLTPGEFGGHQSQPQDHAFQFICASRPGYLNTPLETGRTPEEQADACAALLDFLGIESAMVIGVSGGGPSAVQFAARHPERTTRLVLLEAVSEKMSIPKPNPVRGLMQFNLAAWLLIQFAKPLQGILANTSLLKRMPSLLTTGLESALPLDLREDGIDNDQIQFTTLAPLPFTAIKAPTLLLHGNRDHIVPYAHSTQASQLIPNCKLITLPGAGHLMTPLNPTIIKTILDFISQPDPVLKPNPTTA